MLTRRRTSARMPRRIGAFGFTLIELMVTIVIMAVAAALAAPSFSSLIGNYRVRSSAESILNGLNLARAEAVRRNSPVSFTLNGAASAWTVAQVAPATTIQTRAAADSNVAVASSNAGLAVTFRPTGLVDPTGTWLTQITVSSAVAGTSARRIDILGGGLIRMCEPGVSSANDPRRC